METEQIVRDVGLRIVDAFVATRTKLQQFELDIEQQRPFLNPKAQASVGAAISDLCTLIRGLRISESIDQWRTTKPDEEWFEAMFEYGSTGDLEHSMPDEQMAFNKANLAISLLAKFQDELIFEFGVGLAEFEYRWQSNLRQAGTHMIARLGDVLNTLKIVPPIRSEIERRAVGKLASIDQGSDLKVELANSESPVDKDLEDYLSCPKPDGQVAELLDELNMVNDSGTPNRIRQWQFIRSWMRDEFGYQYSDKQLWEFTSDRIQRRMNCDNEIFLRMQLDDVVAMMKSGLIGWEPFEIDTERQIMKILRKKNFAELKKFLEQKNSENAKNFNEKRGTARRRRRKDEQKLTSQGLTLVAALCQWHDIKANGKEVLFDKRKPPIGCREVVREYEIPLATVSELFTELFGSHRNYSQKWEKNPQGLAYQLAMLNGEVFCLGNDVPESEDDTDDQS